MTLFDRHEKCIGIRLFKSKTRFIQLWYCPAHYKVIPHSHNDQKIELMYLCGKTTFTRSDGRMPPEHQSFTPRWYHMFHKFTVKAGQRHWFTVSNWPLIFINFATFIDGKKPVSAAIDFHTTT